jgi:N-acetyl-anhydromuramyl-L-alanine amidase AmpD/peptidoglycan/xylan/chitin deacetylase (PgdA/CDA1 family)
MRKFLSICFLLVLPALLISCAVSTENSPAQTSTPSNVFIQPTQSLTTPEVPTAEPSATPQVTIPSPTVEADPPSSENDLPLAERLPILEYHETSFTMSGDRVKMTEAWFRDQMKWLADNGFETLSADALLAYVDGIYLPLQRSVILTFDVGTAKADEYHQIIIPLLRQYDFEAVFFVLTNAITEDGEGNTVSWGDLRTWRDEGLISVQSHGVYHPDYKLLTFTQMLWDAETSSKKIAEEMGEVPRLLAFPFDSVPESNLELLMERSGYQLGLAGNRLERSVLPDDTDRYALPRYYPYSKDDSYPYLSDRQGWTFPEMMFTAIGDFEAASRAALEVETVEPPVDDPEIPAKLDNLISYCALSIPDKIFGLDQYANFPSDISACYQPSLDSNVIIKPTCNFGPAILPEAIVLHFTYGPYSSTVNEFRESELESSAHYIIDRDGTITQMVPEILTANHVTCYGSRELCMEECPICEDEYGRLTEPKFRSIGIELVNVGRLRGEPGDFRNPDGSAFPGLVYEDETVSWGYRYWEDYPPEQITALRLLLIDIMYRWNIPLELVLAHGDVQRNKIDPGPALNLTWDRTGDPTRLSIFQSDFSVPDQICILPSFPDGHPKPSE